MRGVVAVACAAVMVAGCSARADEPPVGPPSVSVEERVAAARSVVAKLGLPESVTGPLGLVAVGEPEEGVRPLVSCLELASAGQALAGRTQRWTWTSAAGGVATYSVYAVVYEGITAREVVKQARAVSGCHPRGQDPSGLDRQSYHGENLPSTRPLIDDRFAFCETDPVDYGVSVEEWLATSRTRERRCTGLFAEGQKLLRLHYAETIDNDPAMPWFKHLTQPLVDSIVAD